MERKYKEVSSARKRAENLIPFNHNVPDIFNHGSGQCQVDAELSAKIKCLAALGDSHTTAREWRDACRKVERELMEECWLCRRILGDGEFSQLMWIREGGHWDWWPEEGRVRSRMDQVMNKYNAWYAEPTITSSK
jgi:hypothetical protein